MTNTRATEGLGVNRPSQFARTASTLRLHHLMEERQRLEIAARVTQLRERSRWTQPDIAEMLGLTLRGYQKIEEKGTTKYERAEEIARIHGVDPDWVWDGAERSATPDVLGALSSTDSELLREVASQVAGLASSTAALESQVQELLLRIPGQGVESDGR